jgi:phenylalanine ammonia-lyase
MVLEGVHDASIDSMNGSPFPPFNNVRPNPVETKASTLLGQFITSQRELAKYKCVSLHALSLVALLTFLTTTRNGQIVVIDGHTLTTAGIVAAARHLAPVQLDESQHVKERVAKSRKVIADKVESGASVYGLSTGFGGSGMSPRALTLPNHRPNFMLFFPPADTRTDKPLLLGNALLQHQHVGVLPTSSDPLDVLPLLDPTTSTAMPEAWVR